MSRKLEKPSKYVDITNWLEDFVLTRWPARDRAIANSDQGELLVAKLRKKVALVSKEAAQRLDAWEREWETCPYTAVLSDLP